MHTSTNTKIGALTIAALALAAAGGAFAAGMHHGSKAAAASGLSIGSLVSSRSAGTAHDYGGPGPMHGPGDELTAAAGYLGVSVSDLQTQLQSGKTLAQIATATSGRTTAGLIDALVAAEKTEIAAAVTAGRITQAQADQITATLTDRFTNLVNGTMPPRPFGGPGPMHGPGDELTAAAGYLGVSVSDLQTQLQSGKTLAQIATATSGKTTAGLIDALVAAEKTEIAAAVSAGRITQAQADQITATLTDRFTSLVNGTMPPRPFGGPFQRHNSTHT